MLEWAPRSLDMPDIVGLHGKLTEALYLQLLNCSLLVGAHLGCID